MTNKSAAIYVCNTKNAKLSKFGFGVDATYVSIKSSCSNTCPFYDGGCYAQSGHVAIVLSRLNNESNSNSAAQDEANAIDSSWGGGKIPHGQYLRLHISGDCQTSEQAKIVSSAVSRWIKRGGVKCWSYTHSWKKISRDSWDKISILASVESYSDAKLALKKNYAPAIVVSKFDNPKAFIKQGIKFIPCPAQTFKDVTCLDCKLCFDVDKLISRNCGIAFEAHGVGKNKIIKKLYILQNI